MKIYTKTGDRGDTALWGGQRVPKDALRIQSYGTVDECNAVLGLARASLTDPALDALLGKLQDQLFVVGSDLASDLSVTQVPRIGREAVAALEASIDALESELAPLQQFILPGGTAAAAQLHLARTVCRRAERWVVSLQREEEINPEVVIYLNRLSDLLFVAARVANARAGVADVPWQKP
ncbi:MAG: cob(I)yrinic acid a,c-diamide adenosyltransferase [Candidatus Sericytochromatia bacterium]